MQILRKYIGIVLLALMSFSVMPKEFIHDLYGHEDTIDGECCRKGIIHVEKVHQHCEMLVYAAFPYIGAISYIAEKDVHFIVKKQLIADYAAFNEDLYNLSRFRAPPVV